MYDALHDPVCLVRAHEYCQEAAQVKAAEVAAYSKASAANTQDIRGLQEQLQEARLQETALQKQLQDATAAVREAQAGAVAEHAEAVEARNTAAEAKVHVETITRLEVSE